MTICPWGGSNVTHHPGGRPEASESSTSVSFVLNGLATLGLSPPAVLTSLILTQNAPSINRKIVSTRGRLIDYESGTTVRVRGCFARRLRTTSGMSSTWIALTPSR